MLKCGFIGFGRMGITHFSILNGHPDIEIVSVCDQSKTMLKILGKYLDISTYSNYKEMIAENKLDFVIISTPTSSHGEIINYALDNKLHVFTEKPFVLDIEEGKRIIEKIKSNKVVNQVGYVNRFNEVFVEVKKLIDAGLIGEINQYSSEMFSATVLKDVSSGWRGKKRAGGGCMYEMASHCIDIAIYLFGKPERVMGSELKNVFSSNVEDIVSTTFKHENGMIGNIMVNWSDESYRKPINIIKIFGKKGKIIADKHAYKIYLSKEEPDYNFHKGWNTRYITDFAESVRFYVRGNEFTSQLDYFINNVKNQNNNNIVIDFAEAFKTDKAIMQIFDDHENNQNIDYLSRYKKTSYDGMITRIIKAIKNKY